MSPGVGEAVAVDEDGIGEAVVGVVVGVPWLPLQEQLVLAVAVDITHGDVVGHVAALRLLERKGDEAGGFL